MYSFAGTDGANPNGGLVQGNGKFYGTTYTGGTNNYGTVFSLTLPPPSTTAVTSSPNPSMFGELVTITATVGPPGPPTPTGTVGFTSNGAAIPGCTAVALNSSRTAVCTTTGLAVGTDAIVATYSGDTNYSGSSGGLSQLVNPDSIAAAIRRRHPVPAGGHATARPAAARFRAAPRETSPFRKRAAATFLPAPPPIR